MAVANETSAERGSLIIMETDVMTGDRSAGKPCNKQSRWISSVIGTYLPDGLLAVINTGIDVTPPCHFIPTVVFTDVGQTKPNNTFPT